MSETLAARLVARGTAVVGAVLVVVGFATGGLLHWSEVRALDRTLLAAAHGEAHPDPVDTWEVEHARAPVTVWRSPPGDPRLPARLRAEALRRERPLFVDLDDRRVLLLVAEPDDEDDDTDEGAPDAAHLLIAAAAPRATLARTLGAFSVAYLLVAVAAAACAAGLQRRVVRGALAPLDQARREAARVNGLGSGERLSEQGPAEVRALLSAMNAVLERLDTAFRAQARFTAEAAHELRTPVTILLGELDVTLRRPRDADAYRETLTSMRASVDRLRSIVEGLTGLARLDAGQADGLREQMPASALARRALDAEARTLAEAGCTVSLDVAGDPVVRVHVALVEAALGNLLRNAAKHAAGSPVALRVEAAEGRAVFTVDDGGPGVPEDLRESVFDRFARAGEARRRHPEGLGLGLPLAREVARRHGGDCRLEAAPTGGARAVLSLPIDS